MISVDSNISLGESGESFQELLQQLDQGLSTLATVVGRLSQQYELDVAKSEQIHHGKTPEMSAAIFQMQRCPSPMMAASTFRVDSGTKSLFMQPSSPHAAQGLGALPLVPEMKPHPGYIANPEETARRVAMDTTRVTMMRRHGTVDPYGKGIEEEQLIVARPSKAAFWALSPDSVLRTCFDVLGILVLLLDAFAMPFSLAFDLQDKMMFVANRRMRLVFWSLDIPINLITAFWTSEHKLEVRLQKTALRYLRSWMALDLSIVLAEYVLLIAPDTVPGLQYAPLLVVVRFIRQSSRFRDISQKAKLSSPITGVHLLMDVSQILLAIVIINHIVSCGWYAIGTGRVYESSWLKESGLDSRGVSYVYATGMHWALTQMTPGSMEVFPVNTLERVYNVVILLFGMIVGTTLTATLTSMMTQHRLAIEGVSKRFIMLQRYLRQERVNHQLSMLIKKQVKARQLETKRIKMKEVQDLSLVAQALRDELGYQVSSNRLRLHPLFNLIEILDKSAMSCICNEALHLKEFPQGDFVFQEGTTGNSMFFLTHGVFRYTPGPQCMENGFSIDDPRLTLRHGQYVSEPPLWVKWEYLGTLSTNTTCEVQSMTPDSLQQALRKHLIIEAVIGEFSHAFCRYSKESVEWSDLGNSTDHHDVITSLSRSARIALAEPILQQMADSNPWVLFRASVRENERLKDLRQEVESGKCNITIHDGEAVRTVSLVVIQIQKPGHSAGAEEYLVEIGEANDEQDSASCKLPGTKRRDQETSRDALLRHLRTGMIGLGMELEVAWSQTEDAAVMMESTRYGIRSRYIRTTFVARVARESKLSQVTVPLTGNAAVGGPALHTASVSPWPVQTRRWGSRLARVGPLASIFKMFRRRASHGGAGGRRGSADEGAARSMDAQGGPVSSWQIQEQAMEVFRRKSSAVVLDTDGGKHIVYLWLSSTEQAIISHPKAKPVVADFLSRIAPDVADCGTVFVKKL